MCLYKNFTILITTHNNYKTIGALLANIGSLDPEEILIVDRGSDLNFRQILKSFQRNNTRIKILEYPDKKNKYKALEQGFEKYLKKDNKYLLTIDAKSNYSRKEIQDVMDVMFKKNFAILTRVRKTSKRINLRNPYYMLTMYLMYGIFNKDPESDLAAYRRDSAKKLLDLKNYSEFVFKRNQEMYKNRDDSGFICYGVQKSKEKVSETLKNIFSVPNMYELRRDQQPTFIVSFLLPLLLIYAFLHLYAMPFGYAETFEKDDSAVSISRDNFYTIAGQEVLDGVTEVTVAPVINKADVWADIEVKGDDNLFIIPNEIDDEDIIDVWEYQRSFEEDFDYKLLDDYNVRDTKSFTFPGQENTDIDYLAFKLDLNIDLEEEIEKPQMIMKYEGLELIRHEDKLELRLKEKHNSTHRVFYDIPEIQRDSMEIIAVHKKANEQRDTQGYLALYANLEIANRPAIEVTPITQPPISNRDINTKWNDFFKGDVSQDHISLKQSKVQTEIEWKSSRTHENIQNYYLDTYKQNREDVDVDIENSCKNDLTKDVCRLGGQFNRIYENDNEYVGREQVFYDKEFFNSFNGEINEIKVGYQNPFREKKSVSNFYSRTPFTAQIFGERASLEELYIRLRKDSVW